MLLVCLGRHSVLADAHPFPCVVLAFHSVVQETPVPGLHVVAQPVPEHVFDSVPFLRAAEPIADL